MARFNLADYETVDERLRRFWKDNPNARISTRLVRVDGEVGKTRWVTRAEVFTDASADEPTATGLAFEVDGQGMANQTSALENCETSAVGRALANAGYSGDRRASQQEMLKVRAGEYHAKIEQATTVEQVQDLWREADKEGLLGGLHEVLRKRADEIKEAQAGGDGGAA